jgi:hypothetical protein
MISNKNIRKIIFLIILCLIVIVGFYFIAYITFNSVNPFISGYGLFKIYFLNIEYVVIHNNPQIILTKPEGSLNKLMKYMSVKGFNMVDQLGSIVVFRNNTSEEILIKISINKYFSRWVWN